MIKVSSETFSLSVSIIGVLLSGFYMGSSKDLNAKINLQKKLLDIISNQKLLNSIGSPTRIQRKNPLEKIMNNLVEVSTHLSSKLIKSFVRIYMMRREEYSSACQ